MNGQLKNNNNNNHKLHQNISFWAPIAVYSVSSWSWNELITKQKNNKFNKS